MPTIISKNETYPFQLPYLYQYSVAIETPKLSVARMYTTKNELTLVIKIPKSAYSNEAYQKLVSWSRAPVFDKNYYRDIGVKVVEGKFERSVVFTHAMIVSFDEYVETKSDYITTTVVFHQKLDKTAGVKLGGNYEETFAAAFEKVNNPPRLDIFVGAAVKGNIAAYTANIYYAKFYTINPDNKKVDDGVYSVVYSVTGNKYIRFNQPYISFDYGDFYNRGYRETKQKEKYLSFDCLFT